MAVNSSFESAGTRTPAEKPRSSAAAILFTALGVVVIAACAVLLSYNGIYQIAVQGNVDPQYSHLYPAVFTLLVLMALWTGYVLRTAPRGQRLWADGLILLLVVMAAGASALEASGFVLVPAVATVVAAVAPWLALLVAFRLFLSVVMHLRGEVPGTGPGRPRKQRRTAGGAERAAENRSADLPTEDLRQEKTRSLGELLGSGSAHPAAEADRPQEPDDGEAPQPPDPESADFRDPGLRPPRPAPTERPSRPERPSSLEPPEPAEAPEPARKRRGFLARRSGGTDTGRRPDDAPSDETAEEAAAEGGSPAGTDSAAETAALWPNAAAASAGPGGEAVSSAVSVLDDDEDDDFPFDEPEDAQDGRSAREFSPAAGAAGENSRAHASRQAAAADGSFSRAAAAPQPGTGGEADPGPADADAGGTDADRADTAAAAGPATGAAGAHPAEDAPDLPKRRPGAAENPIKRAADSPPVPEPLGDAYAGTGTADEDSAEDPPAAPQADPAEGADGFVHVLPFGDPTNDEAEPDADPPAAAAAPADAPAPEDGGASEAEPAESRPAGTDGSGTGDGPAYPAAHGIAKRPMVLKPRRTPQDGPSSPFPKDPPSNRVRSEPRPPEE